MMTNVSGLTDWGKEAIRLRSLSKKEILAYMAKLGYDDRTLLRMRHKTKNDMLISIVRVTSHQYDVNGMLLSNVKGN